MTISTEIHLQFHSIDIKYIGIILLIMLKMSIKTAEIFQYLQV